MAGGDDGEVSRGVEGKAGTGSGEAEATRERLQAGDLAARGVSGRGAGGEPAGGGDRVGVSGVQAAGFYDDANGTGSGAREIWSGTGFLLPAGSALGGGGVSECAAAGDA